jgi:hypothetical protein
MEKMTDSLLKFGVSGQSSCPMIMEGLLIPVAQARLADACVARSDQFVSPQSRIWGVAEIA